MQLTAIARLSQTVLKKSKSISQIYVNDKNSFRKLTMKMNEIWGIAVYDIQYSDLGEKPNEIFDKPGGFERMTNDVRGRQIIMYSGKKFLTIWKENYINQRINWKIPTHESAVCSVL